jgi:hypothetical protein
MAAACECDTLTRRSLQVAGDDETILVEVGSRQDMIFANRISAIRILGLWYHMTAWRAIEKWRGTTRQSVSTHRATGRCPDQRRLQSFVFFGIDLSFAFDAV